MDSQDQVLSDIASRISRMSEELQGSAAQLDASADRPKASFDGFDKLIERKTRMANTLALINEERRATTELLTDTRKYLEKKGTELKLGSEQKFHQPPMADSQMSDMEAKFNSMELGFNNRDVALDRINATFDRMDSKADLILSMLEKGLQSGALKSRSEEGYKTRMHKL